MAKQAMRMISLVFVACTAMTAANAAEWQLVEDSSNVRFIGSQEGTSFRGRFESFSAEIDFDPANPGAGKIVGVVQMGSAKSGDAERDATLMEEDWFNPQEFPESRYESERIEALDDGTFAAHGQITIIGVTQPVTMIFEFEVDGSTANFSGNFDLKRLDFGMGWDTTNWIANEVAVQVRLKLQQ